MSSPNASYYNYPFLLKRRARRCCSSGTRRARSKQSHKVYLGAPRCSPIRRQDSRKTSPYKFKNFGSSSEKRPESRRGGSLNPYYDVEKMALASFEHSKAVIQCNAVDSKKELNAAKDVTIKSYEMDPAEPRSGEFNEQTEDDDDEEENGLPQAVRASEPSSEPMTFMTLIREYQSKLMEKMARENHPQDLSAELEKQGFYNADYNQYSRGVTDQFHQNGSKRSIDRLFQILATTKRIVPEW